MVDQVREGGERADEQAYQDKEVLLLRPGSSWHFFLGGGGFSRHVNRHE